MAKCKECGALIDWVQNTETGKKMPINREEICFMRNDRGNLRILHRNEIVFGYQVGDANENLYELGCAVHFDTCKGGVKNESRDNQ